MTDEERNRIIQNASISLGISAPVGVGVTEAYNQALKGLEVPFGKGLYDWGKLKGLKRVGVAAATAIPLAVGGYLALNKLTKPSEEEDA